MPDLTSQELDVLRVAWIFDKVDESANPKVYLSQHNRSTRSVMFPDATLQALNAHVEDELAEELARVYEAKRLERVRHGDGEVAAAEAAATSRLTMKFRMIRAACRRLSLADPGTIASMKGAAIQAVTGQWKDDIAADENALRKRQGMFGIPFLRG